MPLYEYLCAGCGGGFELLVRREEEPACPECGDHRLEKQFSVPAAHVQGKSPLPMAELPQGCGRPGCGPGGCAM